MVETIGAEIDPWRPGATQHGAFKLAAVIGSWDDAERAALVALLRTRPNGLTWSQITAEVDARGSPLRVWRAT